MKVYLDYSATTPLDREVLAAMTPYFCDCFGNADSVHSFGREGAYAVDNARRQVAKAIGAQPKDIYFTSGGTEADNWAIKGIAKANADFSRRIVVSSIEHAAVLSAAAQLEGEGFEVVYLPVENSGKVLPQTLENALKEKPTSLVSIMTANNEIGTIQPIKELCEIAHAHGAVMHTDAVQAVGSVAINVLENGVDALTISAHKFYGPKGVGALYIKSGVKIQKLISGGHQEKTRRGGTTAVPLVVGLGKAIEMAICDMPVQSVKIKNIRDEFTRMLLEKVPGIVYNGDAIDRLPQNANFTFPNTDGDALVMALDLNGIACSSGAACSAGSLQPSHVMQALGYSSSDAKKSVRFSFGKYSTMEEVEYCVIKIAEAYERLVGATTLIARVNQNSTKV